jgi:hypothetical protein
MCGPYDPVHRAAANDVDLNYRAACGSVCNELFCRLSHSLFVWDGNGS